MPLPLILSNSCLSHVKGMDFKRKTYIPAFALDTVQQLSALEGQLLLQIVKRRHGEHAADRELCHGGVGEP